MSPSKGEIEKSLTARGRPAMWANEQETAVLSGLSPSNFNVQVRKLEEMGFPKKSPLTNKRYIPAIEQFWDRQCGVTHNVYGSPPQHASTGRPAEYDDSDGKESFTGKNLGSEPGYGKLINGRRQSAWLEPPPKYDFDYDAVHLNRFGKRIKYPPWTWQLLDRYHDHPQTYVYLAGNKVYWRRVKRSHEFAEVVTDPRMVDAYAATLPRP